ncbi:GNAT family N-acetyltransferase [Brevibacterium antiquum]|nr:GNAT family N-acetyltransferase [Brevibacterium antiquum]
MPNTHRSVADRGEDWASSLVFSAMTIRASHEIADTWKYPHPYDFYDVTADPDDYHEFVSPKLWPEVFQQIHCHGDLVGFFSAQPIAEGTAFELSLGMHPSLTGNGRGLRFVNSGLAWLDDHEYQGRMVLSVASFNMRAIKVYQAAGFVKIRDYAQVTNGGTFDFVEMDLVRST